MHAIINKTVPLTETPVFVNVREDAVGLGACIQPGTDGSVLTLTTLQDTSQDMTRAMILTKQGEGELGHPEFPNIWLDHVVTLYDNGTNHSIFFSVM